MKSIRLEILIEKSSVNSSKHSFISLVVCMVVASSSGCFIYKDESKLIKKLIYITGNYYGEDHR